MKPYLKALKYVNLIWLAIVILILILAAVPAIPGTVLIKLPGPDGWTTTEVGGIINITGNISVYNGGIFQLDSFLFFILLLDDEGDPMLRFESPNLSLPPGVWMRFPVSIEFKSSESASSDIQALFFSKVSLMGMIYFNAEYLFQFDVQGMLIGETSMGPLIKNYQIYTEKAEVQEYGDQCLLDIPYDVVSSYLLFGSGLNVDGTVSNATQVLGEFSTVAPLGGACSGNLTMVLSRDAYLHLKEFPDTLYMNCTMAFGPFSWLQNYTVAWTPPPAQSDTDSSPLPTDVDHSYVKSTGTPAAGGV